MSIVRPGLEQVDPGPVADGTYAVTVVSGTITNLTLLGTTVAAIVPGANVTVDNTDPTHPIVTAAILEPLTTEIGGVPDFVWDGDNKLVMTEAH